MADFVESFVATLGLDDRDFKRGQKEYDQSTKRMRETSDRTSKDMEASQRRVAAGYRTVRNEVGGLLLAFAGASSLKSFVTDMLAGDAATGRLARNLDLSTNRLHAWQEAVKTVGGTANDTNASLQTVVSTLADAVYRGDYGKGFNLAALGMSYGDLKNPDEALLKMAAAGERMSKIKFVNILTSLGINPATINLLELGRRDLEALLAQKERDAPLTAKQTEEAEKFQKAWADITTQIQGAARPALYSLVDGLLKTGDAAAFVKGTIDVLSASLRGLTSIGDSLAAIGLRADMYYSGLRARAAPTPQLKQYYLDRASEDAQKLQEIAERNDARFGRGGAAPSGGGGGGTYRPGTFGRPSQSALDRIAPSGAGGGGQSAIISRLMAAGYTSEQARGIAAGIGAESGYNARAVNPTSGAYGLGQWLGPRKKELMRRYGPNPTAEQQMEFLVWELKGGDHGGAAVGRQTTADHTLLAYVHNFMRPGAGAAGDMQRGRAILGGRPARGAAAGNRSTSQTTTVGQITIVVPNGDPDTIAKGVRGALAKHEIVNQANTGMTP